MVRRGSTRLEGRTPAVVFGDLTLVRPLARAGIPVIVAASNRRDPILRSRHAREVLIVPPVVESTERELLDALCRAGEQISGRTGSRPLFVYGSDALLAFVYRHRAALEQRFAMLLNRPEIAESLFDKQLFHAFAAARGVTTPDTLSPEEPLEAARRFAGRVVIKPRTKGGASRLLQGLMAGHKARVLELHELLREPDAQRHRERLVIQEHLEANVRDLVSYHGFADERGRVLTEFCGRKLRTRPASGGDSSFIELYDDPRLASVGRDVVGRLGIVGAFKLDFLRTARDELVVLEANLRFTLWNYLGAVSGANVPAAAYRHLVEGLPPESQPPSPTASQRPRKRWVNLVRDLAARSEVNLSYRAWLASLVATPKLYELFAWDDPVPAAVWLEEALARRYEVWRRSV